MALSFDKFQHQQRKLALRKRIEQGKARMPQEMQNDDLAVRILRKLARSPRITLFAVYMIALAGSILLAMFTYYLVGKAG